MQIRHSYSIGSIVPFSSSTTFTSTNKNKDSSKCISYRPGPHFLTCKYNLVSPTGACALSEWTGAFPSARSWESLHPLLRGRSSFRFPRCLRLTVTSSGLVLKGSPTSNNTDDWKESSACLYWGELRDGTTGYGVFVVFLRGVQGTEMVCGSKSCASRCESIREVRLCLRVHTAAAAAARWSQM